MLMTRDEILDLVSKMDNLPRLPQVAIKLMEISMDDQTSAKDIADIVMEDPAITAYLLKLINSPFYGLREKITTVSHGIALLGVDVVKNVVLSLAVLDIMKNKAANSPALRNYWEHSLYTAIAARLFAQQIGYPAPEKAFIAGLLADLGSLILWGIDPILYKKVLRKDDGGRGDRSAVEKAFYGLDHTEAGMALAQVWNLPEEYVGVISLHHNLDILADLEDETIKTLGEFVHLGSVVASIFILGEDGFKTGYLKSVALSLFSLQEKVIDALLLRSSRQLESLLVDADLGPLNKKSYFKILQDSNKKLGENNLKLTRSLMEHERMKKVREELLAMVSEDVKSPLSAIIGYSSHLLDDLPAKRSELLSQLQEIYNSGKKSLSMINEWTKLMEMEETDLQVSPIRGDMGLMLTEFLEMVAERVQKKDIKITHDFQSPMPSFPFDEYKLGHAFINLLELAMMLAGEGGEISLKSDVVTIPGESQSQTGQKRLFELCIEEHGPVSDDSKRTALRSTLKQPEKITRFSDHLNDSGVYLARSIINSHGGQVKIEWGREGNSAFIVQLPISWPSETLDNSVSAVSPEI
jgi:HD-like signal output (HDOD) protein